MCQTAIKVKAQGQNLDPQDYFYRKITGGKLYILKNVVINGYSRNSALLCELHAAPENSERAGISVQ